MQTMIEITSPLFIPGSALDQRPSWDSIFANSNPLVFEIGCGVGDFAVEMARRHPHWNYIALDYYNKGCLKTCNKAERAGLTNLRVVRDEARAFMARCLPPAALQAVFINCPDPWPKRYQRKRRLVNDRFAEFLQPFLMPGGDLYFTTDFDDYGEDVAVMLARTPGYVNCLAPDLWRHDIEDYPRTKYMRKFMSEGKQIFFVHYQRSG